jgi:hypothetical protein
VPVGRAYTHHPRSKQNTKFHPLPRFHTLDLLATEGRATRQRPRLLLGRSVFGPHFNVALPIFQTSACSETLVLDSKFFTLFYIHGSTSFPHQSHTFPLPVLSSSSITWTILLGRKIGFKQIPFRYAGPEWLAEVCSNCAWVNTDAYGWRFVCFKCKSNVLIT